MIDSKQISKKVNITIILILLTALISCSSKKYESGVPKESVYEISDLLLDKEGLKGCAIVSRLSKWNKFVRPNKIGWNRHHTQLTSIGGRFSSSISLDGRTDTVTEHNKKNKNLAYVGPWQYVDKIGKKIRLFATQNISGWDLYLQYETYTKERAKIKEKPLSIIKTGRRPQGECMVRWIDKFGYNGVAENHRQLIPGFWNWIFRNHEIIVTGKIIEAEE